MFITFEGIDGSGKSTILNMLQPYLINKYGAHNFVFTREPGGLNVPEAEKIRNIILDPSNEIDGIAEVLLYAASRRIHLKNLVLPSLKKGKIVLSDRYVDSSLVYQSFGREISYEKVLDINNFATNNFWPDKTLIFVISKDESNKRRHQRDDIDRLDASNEDFFTRVYDGYMSLLKNDKAHRFINIDASLSIDEVFEEVKFQIDLLIKPFLL